MCLQDVVRCSWRVECTYYIVHSALIGAIVQLGQLGNSQQSTRQHQLLIRAIILWKSGCYWALLLLIIGSWLCKAWMPVGAKLSLLSMRDFPGRGIVHRAASAMRCRWRQTFDWFHKILTAWMIMMLDTSWPWRLHSSSSWPGVAPSPQPPSDCLPLWPGFQPLWPGLLLSLHQSLPLVCSSFLSNVWFRQGNFLILEIVIAKTDIVSFRDLTSVVLHIHTSFSALQQANQIKKVMVERRHHLATSCSAHLYPGSSMRYIIFLITAFAKKLSFLKCCNHFPPHR